jgi:hypothetical protein
MTTTFLLFYAGRFEIHTQTDPINAFVVDLCMYKAMENDARAH